MMPDMEDCRICGRLPDMWKTVGYVEDCRICGRLPDMWKTVGYVEDGIEFVDVA
jgi:hypothetical protein